VTLGTSTATAICTEQVNAPYGSPSLMPSESEAPPPIGTPSAVITLEWPPIIDVPACVAAINALLAAPEFATQSGSDHVEVGLAAEASPDECGKDCSWECSGGCWQVQFYDYDLRQGFAAFVTLQSATLLRMGSVSGVHPSPAEAKRVLELGLADPVVGAAYVRTSQWSQWLIDTNPSNEECRVNRCVLARTWSPDGLLLAFWVNLHTGAVRTFALP
jgi:hypothetical protein